MSIDDPPIVVAFMAASLGLFWLGFHGSELALTAAISYFAMGLLYEWTHYIVHTRYGAGVGGASQGAADPAAGAPPAAHSVSQRAHVASCWRASCCVVL